MANEFYINNVTGKLDIDAFVKSLTLPKQKALSDIKERKALHQAKASSIINLLSGIKDLKDTVSNLKIDQAFKGKSVSVSDSSVLSATASDNTPNVTLKVKVAQLSQEEMRLSSGGVSSLNDTLGQATFTLQYYKNDTDYEETNINFTGGTLNDLVSTINSSQNRVQASVFFDGSKYKLLLTEKDVGASTRETESANNKFVIEISSGSLPSSLGSLQTLQEAKNAKLELPNGNILTSATNTFKDVIPGLTITAQKTSNDFVTINIKEDYSSGEKTISDLLNKVNAVLDLVKPMIEKGGQFQGNATIVQIKGSFLRLTKPLQELGLVNIGDDGKFTSRSEAYDKLIAEGKVKDIKNALGKVKEGLISYLEGLEKTFSAYIRNEELQIKRLNEKAENINIELSKEEKKLRLIFSKIEALMNKNEALKTRLESFVQSLSDMNKK